MHRVWIPGKGITIKISDGEFETPTIGHPELKYPQLGDIDELQASDPERGLHNKDTCAHTVTLPLPSNVCS